MDIFDDVTHFRCYDSNKKKLTRRLLGSRFIVQCNPPLPPRHTFLYHLHWLTNIFGKNQFPSSLVNKTVKEYLQFDLPLIGPFSTTAQHRFKRLTQRYYIEVIVLRERLKMKV